MRLKRMLETYKTQNLDPIDIRLIKGIFYRNNKDFDDENHQAKQTLYERLLNKD